MIEFFVALALSPLGLVALLGGSACALVTDYYDRTHP